MSTVWSRLIEGGDSYLGGYMPPLTAASHFAKAQGFTAFARELRAPRYEDLQRIGHIARAAIAASVAPVLLINFKFEKLPIGMLIWVGIYNLDRFSNNLHIAAINVCRCVHGLFFGGALVPSGFTRGSAVSDGNCFYHSVLQQVQPGALQDDEQSRQALRNMIAGALEGIGRDDAFEHKQAFDNLIAATCRLSGSWDVQQEHYERIANEIRKNRWADHLELAVLTLQLDAFKDIKLEVYQVRTRWTWAEFFTNSKANLQPQVTGPRIIPDQNAASRKTTVHLINWDETHYEPLFPLN